MEPSIPTTPAPPPPPPPPPARKSNGLRLVVAGGVALFAILAAIAVAAGSADDDTAASSQPGSACENGEWQPGTRNQCVNGAWVAQESDAPTPTTRPRPTTTTTAPPVMPTAADYSLTLITESKQCFGSAGCNLTLKTNLAIVGPAAQEWDEPVSITYQIDGLEDGPVIGTLYLAGGQYVPETEVVQTTSQGVEPTVTITAVR